MGKDSQIDDVIAGGKPLEALWLHHTRCAGLVESEWSDDAWRQMRCCFFVGVAGLRNLVAEVAHMGGMVGLTAVGKLVDRELAAARDEFADLLNPKGSDA